MPRYVDDLEMAERIKLAAKDLNEAIHDAVINNNLRVAYMVLSPVVGNTGRTYPQFEVTITKVL